MKSVRVACSFWSRLFLFSCFPLFCASVLSAQNQAPVFIWPQPAAIPFGTPLSSVQLDADVLAGPPVSVPLAGSANVMGITSSGFKAQDGGGFDGSTVSWAEEQIGSTITWHGTSFPILPADQNDAVSSGATIPLPAGSFSQIWMLADMVNDLPAPDNIASFTIAYTDGTTSSFTQQMSDWVFPRNYTLESVVSCYPWRHDASGANQYDAACVYGYVIPLLPGKTAVSLTLPQGSGEPPNTAPNTPVLDRNFVVLALTMVPPVLDLDGTLTYTPASDAVLSSGNQTLSVTFTPSPGTGYQSAAATVPLAVTPPAKPLATSVQWAAPAPIYQKTPLGPRQLDAQGVFQPGPVLVPIFPSASVDAAYTDGSQFFNSGGFDGMGNAFSATQLGSSLTYLGYSFPLSTPNIPSAASGSTIAIPQGMYTSLLLLGAAGNGAQLQQTFTLLYIDGSLTNVATSLSSWDASQGFPNETVVASTTYANDYQGNQHRGTYDVYGYQLPIDSSKQLIGVTLPSNPNVNILAIGAVPLNPVKEDGKYVYTPPEGTTLPLGEDTLNVVFAPNDTIDLAPSNGNTTIDVVEPTLTVTGENYTRLYGAPNPALQGTVTGAQYGDAFTAACTSTATQQSAPGVYPVVCTAQGSDISAYQQVEVNGALTITKAPVTAQVVSSVTTIVQGQPVTLTATITSTTTGTPTGTVQFLAGGTVFATESLTSGAATLSTTGLPVGEDTITAVYSGDTDFLGATAGTANPVDITSADFTFTAPNGLVLTDTFGHSGSLTLEVQPLSSVYYGNVTFFRDSGLPDGATSSFSPNIVIGQCRAAGRVLYRDQRVTGEARRRPVSHAGAAAVHAAVRASARRAQTSARARTYSRAASAWGPGAGAGAHRLRLGLSQRQLSGRRHRH